MGLYDAGFFQKAVFYGGTALLWIAVVLTLYSGYEYVRDFFRKTGF